MKQIDLCEQVSETIQEKDANSILRLGIDGIDAAGKTTFGDILALYLAKDDRPVIRASLDDFHNPRQVRYQRGELSAEGYYLDSFNYPVLRTCLLNPLSPGGSGRYRLKAFDLSSDSPSLSPELQAPERGILVFDGIFLQRPELAGTWDVVIFLQISFETCLRRAKQRDLAVWETEEIIEQRYQQRYFPAQKHYLETCRPVEQADIVIEDTVCMIKSKKNG
jgi:uridine kinase